MDNYYEILGVEKNASLKQIKQAYISLLKMYHPDVYSGDKSFAEKRTAEITMAYSVLRNYVQRKNYDEKLAKEQAFNNNQTAKKYPFTSMNTASKTYKQKQEKQKEDNFKNQNQNKNKKTDGFFSRIFKNKKQKNTVKNSKIKPTKKVEKVDITDKNVKVVKNTKTSLTKEELREKQAFDLSIALFVSFIFLVIVLLIVL